MLQGFSLLCGMMCGENENKAAHLYNWYVAEGDMNKIVSFE